MIARLGIMLLLLQSQSGNGPESAPAPLQMLGNESVATELKLSKEQQAKVNEVKKANEELLKKLWQEAGITLQNLPEKRKEADIVNRKLNDAANKALAGLLNPMQSKRFAQINLQQQGLRAFATSEVQKGLKLNETQQRKIKESLDELSKQRARLFDGLKPGERDKFQEATQKYAEEHQKTLFRIAAILSAEQKKLWKEMIGEPFMLLFKG